MNRGHANSVRTSSVVRSGSEVSSSQDSTDDQGGDGCCGIAARDGYDSGIVSHEGRIDHGHSSDEDGPVDIRALPVERHVVVAPGDQDNRARPRLRSAFLPSGVTVFWSMKISIFSASAVWATSWLVPVMRRALGRLPAVRWAGDSSSRSA